MPQIKLRRLIEKLDRRRLIVGSVIAVVGLGGWFLLREKPRPVADPEWDNIVFADMAAAPVPDVEPLPVPASEEPRAAAPQPRPQSRGMQIEVAANTALQLDAEWRPAPRPVPGTAGVPLVSEPTRLEGGIEPIGAPAQ